jgi:hypothetical protein
VKASLNVYTQDLALAGDLLNFVLSLLHRSYCTHYRLRRRLFAKWYTMKVVVCNMVSSGTTVATVYCCGDAVYRTKISVLIFSSDATTSPFPGLGGVGSLSLSLSLSLYRLLYSREREITYLALASGLETPRRLVSTGTRILYE